VSTSNVGAGSRGDNKCIGHFGLISEPKANIYSLFWATRVLNDVVFLSKGQFNGLIGIYDFTQVLYEQVLPVVGDLVSQKRGSFS